MWVVANEIKPAFAVGAQVNFDDRGVTREGEVTRVDAATAEYLVFVPALGHVRSGLGATGRILPYEAVAGISTTPVEPAPAPTP